MPQNILLAINGATDECHLYNYMSKDLQTKKAETMRFVLGN